ncbi:MAG TPA: hypothetical protein VGU68_07265 [Ktedonobacteraceae bacterium]|nr:hypothetical protein [Ktedonobacteraceae bacterium]
MNDHGYDHLQTILERLKLARVPEQLDQLAETAAKESWTSVEFLDRVQGAGSERPHRARRDHENTPGSLSLR